MSKLVLLSATLALRGAGAGHYHTAGRSARRRAKRTREIA
jgi:hypothetical protein